MPACTTWKEQHAGTQRGARLAKEMRKMAMLRESWGEALENDPYSNPYLDLSVQGLALHPRRAS